jgi:Methyltransferase domain
VSSLLKSKVPQSLRKIVSRLRRRLESNRNAGMSPEEVFSRVYKNRMWGDPPSSMDAAPGQYFSGSGSAAPSVVQPYIDAMIRQLESHLPAKPKVVDLGCGDFTVGRQLLEYCATYIGVDVVPDLISHLRATVHDDRAQFLAFDIISANVLPDGDVCILRQVLQHLSNAQISAIIPKLAKYERVYVTEHYPAASQSIVPNRDKIHGSDIRLYENSGVYLDRSPFDVPRARLELILEVRAPEIGTLYEAGIIRTYLYRPQKS